VEREWETAYLLQILQAGINQLLLLSGDLANIQNLLNTIWSQLNLAGEEINTLVLEERRVNKGWLNNTLLSLSGLQQALGETGTGHGHREGSGSSTVLSLNNLITTELNTLEQVCVTDEIWVGRLREERDDGDTGVTSNNDNVLINWVGLLDLGNESGSADNVKSGNTEESLWVVNSLGLEDLGNDWDGAVDWVGNNEDVGIWGRFSGGLCEVTNDGGVGVEKIVTGHSWLSGDTSWDQDNFGTLEGGGKATWCWVITLDVGASVNVGDICGDT